MQTSTEQLRALADHMLETAKKQLSDGAELMPMVHLVDASDNIGDAIFGIEGTIMNDVALKQKFADMIRREVKDHGYSAALMLVDSFTMKPKNAIEAETVLALQRAGLTLQQVAERGIGELLEAVTVFVQSKDDKDSNYALQAIYKRDTDGKIQSFSEPSMFEGALTGRMKFFD